METLSGPAEYEAVIKKSRFVCRAGPADSPEEAMAFLEAVRDPQATHNCWAYRIGDAYRFSDDGEPGGTAGRPILAAIEAQGLDRVVVVVTRYFGGIKLGTGGLARAYGGVAAQCLRGAPRRPLVRFRRVRVRVPFAAIEAFYRLLPAHGGEKLAEAYGEEAVFTVRIPEDRFAAFARALADATRGAARVEVA